MKEIKKNIKGKEYWRSLDQMADTPEFKQFLEREFPEHASEMTNPVTRRNFLGLMGASIAFAGLTSCRRPVEKIVPYVKAPEDVLPGIPQFYATTAVIGAHAYGLLVESHGGRPTKIEGNEKHPSSMGKTNAFMQAEVLNVYDPDRSQNVLHDNKESSWQDFAAFWKDKHAEFVKNQGEGLAVLSGEFSSPTLHRLYTSFKKIFPKAVWAVDEPVSFDNVHQGIKAATGKLLRPDYHFDKAKVVVSIDNDFLGTGPESIKSNFGFANARRVESEKDDMNRLYVIESSFSITGGMADHRKKLSQIDIEKFVHQLAHALGVSSEPPQNVVDQVWIKALVDDLKKNGSETIITAGYRQSAAVHALVFLMNSTLGSNNKTITYHDDVYAVLKDADLKQLVSKASKINTLFVLGNNPAYSASYDLKIPKALAGIENVISVAGYVDETAKLAKWHIPLSHFLESWGDASAVDGTLSTVQPLILPLYKSKSLPEVLNLIVSADDKKGHDILQETWKGLLNAANFNKEWRKVLHDGVYEIKSNIVNVSPDLNGIKSLVDTAHFSYVTLSQNNLEVVFHASSSTYDGRYSNNGWLQEAPDPVTKIAWDNAALVSPKTAKELGLQTRELITLELDGRKIETVVSILPGQADYVVSLELGYGRKNIGRIADGTGFNVNVLISSETPFSATGGRITRTGKTYLMANTQDHDSMEGRPLIREASLEEYREDPNFAPEMVEHPPLKALWDEHSYDEGYQWGMTIDLNTCTGCNTCLVACQSENNIPIVGKEQVEKGREMHWMRMDRYFEGDPENPEMVYQPVACQHCENAPCEQVCPVQATLHDKEGLNVMTYNRCIGTRYCSNNCPYKVRRFNFFNYTKDYPETIKMVQNPDVTVRFRGVMEKCTYCTQRLQTAKITAKNEGRMAEDKDVVTACQQACPADAIIFGNINDPESRVAKAKKQNRNYSMLGELFTKPRTTFMAKLRNPNPEIIKLTETVS